MRNDQYLLMSTMLALDLGQAVERSYLLPFQQRSAGNTAGNHPSIALSVPFFSLC